MGPGSSSVQQLESDKYILVAIIIIIIITIHRNKTNDNMH